MPAAIPARYAARTRLGDRRDDDRHTEHVGLKLHQPGVRCSRTICAELLQRNAQRSILREDRIAGLVRDRLKRGAREMGDRAPAGQTDNRAARVWIPVWLNPAR